jgi:RNA polymerase sigma factor (TIGR02999 family)
MTEPTEVTRLLLEWRDGNQDAASKLIPIVYDELRRLASHYLAHERPGHTLQPTALVHEAYLKLVEQKGGSWQDRAHFFAVAAQTMRHLLVDHARAKKTGKRGGGLQRVEVENVTLPVAEAEEVVALDEALTRLKDLDACQANVVELRYFGGLSVQEVAEVLGISERTVRREWTMAKAWLYEELRQKP